MFVRAEMEGGNTRMGSVYLGSTGGLSTEPYATVADAFAVVAAGDVNGDGFDDLISSTLDETYGYGYVGSLHGSASGFTGGPYFYMGNYECFGCQLAALGDVDDDGYDDVAAVSTSWEYSTGRVYVIMGIAGGLTTYYRRVIGVA